MFDDGLHHDGLAGDNLYGMTIAPLDYLTEVQYYGFAEDNTAYSLNDPFIAPQTSYNFIVEKKDYICGDANGDEIHVNVSDAVYIINYVFSGGNPPDPIEVGDVNCDGKCNVSDAVYLISYVFSDGNPPCNTDGDDIPDC